MIVVESKVLVRSGPCFTTATWRCRKNLSQWARSFHWKLCCHWLEFLRQRQIAVVRHGRGARPTNYISIEFEIRPKFAVLRFKMCSTDHYEILHTSLQCKFCCEWLSIFYIRALPILIAFCIWLSKVCANGRRRCLYNLFSLWLIPLSSQMLKTVPDQYTQEHTQSKEQLKRRRLNKWIVRHMCKNLDEYMYT